MSESLQQLNGFALAEMVAVKVMGHPPLRPGDLMLFRPDRDIANAWMVKDHMLKLGWDFVYDEEPSHDEPPCAGFNRGAESYHAQHASGATSICLAALKAVGAG